ncbi:hypothetical protein MMC09_004791 [Bachmanniomyces sp. S44760]|nr:hypothetical protein [Bachmanniomyces sp. S44760]
MAPRCLTPTTTLHPMWDHNTQARDYGLVPEPLAGVNNDRQDDDKRANSADQDAETRNIVDEIDEILGLIPEALAVQSQRPYNSDLRVISADELTKPRNILDEIDEVLDNFGRSVKTGGLEFSEDSEPGQAISTPRSSTIREWLTHCQDSQRAYPRYPSPISPLSPSGEIHDLYEYLVSDITHSRPSTPNISTNSEVLTQSQNPSSTPAGPIASVIQSESYIPTEPSRYEEMPSGASSLRQKSYKAWAIRCIANEPAEYTRSSSRSKTRRRKSESWYYR